MAQLAKGSFTYIDFQQTMGVKDIDNAAFGLIYRAVLDYLEELYDIIVDDTDYLPPSLKYAIYRHMKFLFESQVNNASVIDSMAEGGGNRADINPKIPNDIIEIYKAYSSIPIAKVLNNDS